MYFIELVERVRAGLSGSEEGRDALIFFSIFFDSDYFGGFLESSGAVSESWKTARLDADIWTRIYKTTAQFFRTSVILLATNHPNIIGRANTVLEAFRKEAEESLKIEIEKIEITQCK